jgi:hypothetical protein
MCTVLARSNYSQRLSGSTLQAIKVRALRWQGQLISSGFMADALQATRVRALRWLGQFTSSNFLADALRTI